MANVELYKFEPPVTLDRVIDVLVVAARGRKSNLELNIGEHISVGLDAQVGREHVGSGSFGQIEPIVGIALEFTAHKPPLVSTVTLRPLQEPKGSERSQIAAYIQRLYAQIVIADTRLSCANGTS